MRGGRVRSRLNNVLIHLHNYTAGSRYRGGEILYCCWGRGGFGGCIVVGGEVSLGIRVE